MASAAHWGAFRIVLVGSRSVKDGEHHRDEFATGNALRKRGE
jgi:hypothetical protein